MTIEYFIKNWKNIKEEDISFSEDEWGKISFYQILSEEFIERHENKVDWYCISYSQVLSEDFIERHENKVNWYMISARQKLSEDFIERHENKVIWDYISRYQSLSEQFIEKYENKILWYYISKNQSLSEEFIYKHKDKISHPNCLYKYFRLRYEKYNDIFLTRFSIHTNNSYGLILQWEDSGFGEDSGFNIKNIPANIIFCQSL